MNMVILCKELIGSHSLLRPFPVARSFSRFRRVPLLVSMTGRVPLFSQKRRRMVESKEVPLLTMKARRILASAHTSYTHSQLPSLTIAQLCYPTKTDGLGQDTSKLFFITMLDFIEMAQRVGNQIPIGTLHTIKFQTCYHCQTAP